MITPLNDVQYHKKRAITVGTFDGVHAGHKALLKHLIDDARQEGCTSTLVTFDPHPREVIGSTKGPICLLSTLQERYTKLRALGLDEMVVIPFTRSFSLKSSTEFIEDILVETIGCEQLWIGYDHHYGKDREGGYPLAVELGHKHQFDVSVFPELTQNEHEVSSTAIRRAIHDGDMATVASMLGEHYMLQETVIMGDQRGRTLGYPTLNLGLSAPKKCIPKTGVYAVLCDVQGEADLIKGMANLGSRPTFGDSTPNLEVHLFDYQGNLYGTECRVYFVQRIRDERPFDGPESLVEQLKKDENEARKTLKAV
jgi:riboflavin kinase/FMN adenylyltransferase